MESIGEHLAKLRKEKNLSQKDVTQKTGITDSILSRIESGKNTAPSPIELKKLAELYGAKLIDIYLNLGYLDKDNLLDYQHCFSGVDNLTEEEFIAIQNIISVIIKHSEGLA